MSKITKVLDLALTEEGLAKIRATPVKRGRQESWLLDQIHRIAPDVSGCTNMRTCLLALVEEEVTTLAIAKRVLPRLKELIHPLYNGQMNSIPAYYTKINNILKKQGPEIHAYSKSVMVMDGTEKGARINAGRDAVAWKNEHMVEVNYADMARVLSECIRSPNLADKMVALELASGSRKIELLSWKVALFTPSSENPNWVEQDGVAKNKNAKRVINKPLLVLTFEQFNEALTAVRTEVGNSVELSNVQLTVKFGEKINRRVRALFPAAAKIRNNHIGSHFLRELYGNCTYDVISHKLMPRTTWLSQVLGHQLGSEATALSYQSVRVRVPLPVTNTKISQELQDMRAQFDAQIADMKKMYEGVEKKKTVAPKTTILDRTKNGTVDFLNKDDKVVSIDRFKKKMRMSDQQKKELVVNAITLLTTHNVQITVANTRKLGIGSAICTRYYNVAKQEMGAVPDPA